MRSVFRIVYSVFRGVYSVFRIVHSVFLKESSRCFHLPAMQAVYSCIAKHHTMKTLGLNKAQIKLAILFILLIACMLVAFEFALSFRAQEFNNQ